MGRVVRVIEVERIEIMPKQYDVEKGEHTPVILTTPVECLLKDILVALKQSRSEMRGIRSELSVISGTASRPQIKVKGELNDGDICRVRDLTDRD